MREHGHLLERGSVSEAEKKEGEGMSMDYPRIEKPTEPGSYFYRVASNRPWAILSVHPNQPGSLVADWPGRDWIYVPSKMEGEWRGPIPEPTS